MPDDRIIGATNRLHHELARLKRFRAAVVGWRENDWHEGFSAVTAEALVERAKEAESETGSGK